MNATALTINAPHGLTTIAAKPPAVFLPGAKAAERFFGYFTANIRNKNTRLAYYKAACRFSDWCEDRGLLDLAQVKPPHVAAYAEMLGLPVPDGAGLSKPSVKQHLAALRMLFDWLVVGHVLDTNPAHAVRGPKYSQKKGKTPELDRDEVRALLAVIDTGSLIGLRDRALIALDILTKPPISPAVRTLSQAFKTQHSSLVGSRPNAKSDCDKSDLHRRSTGIQWTATVSQLVF